MRVLVRTYVLSVHSNYRPHCIIRSVYSYRRRANLHQWIHLRNTSVGGREIGKHSTDAFCLFRSIFDNTARIYPTPSNLLTLSTE